MIDKKSTEAIQKLLDIMATLRSPKGCPWDQKQTPETLKPYILEEAYELIGAIDSGDTDEICDELGDLLLQVVFLAQIFKEQRKFGLTEVADSINDKLIRRHPHVFAEESADSHAQRWEEIKRQERTARGKGNKLADRIPNNLPALKKATKIVKKMQQENPAVQIHNIQHNISALSKLMAKSAPVQEQLKSTLGEILFDAVRLTTALKIDAEDILRIKTMKVMAEIDK